MLKHVLIILVLLLLANPAAAWQLQNLSTETRIFDEYHPGYTTPYVKTARPGGSLNFANQPRITVVDRKTGQKVNNPGFNSMLITKEGYLKIR